MTARDLFISHSSDDAEVARALRAVLESAGYTSWMAPDDIVGTDTWTEQILAAIADSKAMLVLVSTASNGSPHVSREVNLALGKRRAVLPIRIEDVAPGGSLEYLLSLVQRVDAFPPPIDAHRDRILRRLDTFLPRLVAGAASAEASTAPAATPTTSPAPAGTPPPPPPALHLTPPVDAKPVEPPPVASRAAARAISTKTLAIGAGAIAVLVVAVVGTGMVLKPGSSAAPSQGAGASPTLGATAQPSPQSPTAAPTAVPLTVDQQLLVGTLPALGLGADGCVAWSTPPGAKDVLSPSGYATSRARVTCSGPEAGGPKTEYALYSSKEALDADFDSIMTSQDVAAGGACSSAIPANAEWNFPKLPNSGKLACFAREGGVQYVWTHRELRVLAQWLATDNATGFAYWQRWSTTLNPAEQLLRESLPATAGDGKGSCVRAEDRYYPDATAMLVCPRTGNLNGIYYAQFASAEDFPNDPMTVSFDSVMTGGGFADDTAEGCYEDAFGRYEWGYKTDGKVGPTEGYFGCYERTDTEPDTAQFVWTFNRTAVMGIWAAPDIKTGVALFEDWIGELR